MKILFLQKRLLFPANTGGKIRTLNVLRHLAKWHDVTYLCNVLPEEESYLEDMRSLGVELIAIPWKEASRESWQFYAGLASSLTSRFPYTVNKDFDPRIRQRAESLLGTGQYDLVICDFVQMARNVIGLNAAPKVLFQHNVEAQIYRRMADNESHPAKRWFIRNQYRKMVSFERDAGRDFERVVAVSHQDKSIFESDYGWNHVDVIDTAVDTDYFQPRGGEKIPGKLVFVGSMDWLPNQEGVERFARQILPTIQREFPQATLDVVGRNPTSRIRQLADLPGVKVTGSVDDVRPYIDRARVAVVPLYAGGGTRLKIFEFMAMGATVVSTSIGAEGLKIEPGKHWIQADEDRDFAKEVVRLLRDEASARQLAQNGREHVCTHFSSESIARQFESICEACCTSAATRRRPVNQENRGLTPSG